MKKIQKSDNKGFTLVELIVVIVILAILAAILVPALLGYIDKAKQQQIVLNGKSALTATQAELSSIYAKGGKPSDITSYAQSIFDTADLPKGDSGCSSFKVGFGAKYDASKKDKDQHAAYTVTYIEYTEGSKTIYYNADANGSSWDSTAPATKNSNDEVTITRPSN